MPKVCNAVNSVLLNRLGRKTHFVILDLGGLVVLLLRRHCRCGLDFQDLEERYVCVAAGVYAALVSVEERVARRRIA